MNHPPVFSPADYERDNELPPLAVGSDGKVQLRNYGTLSWFAWCSFLRHLAVRSLARVVRCYWYCSALLPAACRNLLACLAWLLPVSAPVVPIRRSLRLTRWF